MSETVTQRPRVAGSGFAALYRQTTEAGLLERRPAYYAIRTSVVATMLGGVCAAFVVVGSSWRTLLTDMALSGLNYQIEHHLFPAMPTPNLRRAQPLVKAYCARIGVSYEETSLLQSYRQALLHLHAVGAPLRETRTERPRSSALADAGRAPAGDQ